MEFSLFSEPFEGDFLGLAEHLACSAARALTARLCDSAEELDKATAEQAIAALTPERVSTAPWTPALGAARMELNREPKGSPFAAGLWRTALFLIGALDEVDIAFAASGPLSIAGETWVARHWLVRGDRDSLSIDGDNRRIRRSFVRRKTDGGATVWAADPDRVVRFGAMAAAVLSDSDWMAHWLPETVRGRVGEEQAARRALLNRAGELYLEREPNYYLWIAGVLREVALLASDPSGTQSQSFPLWPGHIQVSQTTLVGMLFVLVHECSHQYFHMALWNGAVAEPDAPLVGSALARRERPIEKVLLGFHAFGNVLLAVRPMRAALAETDVAEFDAEWRWVSNIVAQLDQSLAPAWEKWLAPPGRSLYAPLRARLGAEGLLPS